MQAARTIVLPSGREVRYSSCIYVGKILGKYWFLQNGYIKYMYRDGRRAITKVWCSIRDAYRDKELWLSIPQEVRSVLVQIYGEPTFRDRTREVIDAVTTLLENLDYVLCDRCKMKVRRVLERCTGDTDDPLGTLLRWCYSVLGF